MTPKPDHQNPLPSTSLPEIPAVESSLIKQVVDDDADHPPDSFWLSKDAELDWFDRNAFFERNYSTKGTSTSTSVSSNLPVHNQLTKSKASIIWIPKTTQRRSTFPETKQRRAPPTITLLPKRSDGFNSGKAGTGATNEPSSPKVSCTGRVRQKKDKSKSEKKQNKKTRSRASPETPMSDSSHRRKSSSSSTRLWTKLRDVFRSGKLRATAKDVEVESPAMRWRTKRSKSSRAQHSSMVEPAPVNLTRFSSGRKSDSWIAELKTAIDEVDELRSDQKEVGLWSRRNFDAPKELDCSRDWMDVGPASV